MVLPLRRVAVERRGAEKMTTALCTLYEGDFHHGVAALANSLAKAGYHGDLWVGFRGDLPSWANTEPGPHGLVGVARNGGVRVAFVRLETKLHFGCYKPEFLRQVLTTLAPEVGAVAYTDPDLVVEAPWGLLEPWIHAGLALCEDVNSPFGDGHPWTVAWRAAAARHKIEFRRSPSWYANSGFVGVPRAHVGFLDAWTRAMEVVGAEIGGLDRLKTADQFSPFNSVDQDAFNLAIWMTDIPLQPAGRAAMAFGPGLALLPHALGPNKPWRGGHFKRALLGVPPAYSHKAWLRFANQGIASMASDKLGWLEFELKFAALIGRFYRRS
jgi:hypothetical protein